MEKAAGKSAQPAALEEGLVAVHVLLQLQGTGNDGEIVPLIFTFIMFVCLDVGGVSSGVWSLVGSEQLLSHKLTATASMEGECISLL